MGLGSQTIAVNGIRFTQPTEAQWEPQGYGPQTTGVPQIGPTMPPFVGATSAGGSAFGSEGVGGYGTAGNNALATATANANPHSLKVSPVWWAVGSLLFGLLMLNGINWRRTTLESANEHAHVGAVSESGSEAA